MVGEKLDRNRDNMDRYAQANHVFALLEPELVAEGFDLVDVRVFQGGGRLQVRLSVDLPGEDRINLDGCARASRTASMFLEEADVFPGAWVLEVSSPGIRRPLRTVAHYEVVIGREVSLKWRPLDAPTGRPRNLRGRLDAVTDGMLTILQRQAQEGPATEEDQGAEATSVVDIPLAAVLEANLEHDFDVQEVIREDRRQRKQEKRDRRAQRGGKKNRPKNRPKSDQGSDQSDESSES